MSEPQKITVSVDENMVNGIISKALTNIVTGISKEQTADKNQQVDFASIAKSFETMLPKVSEDISKSVAEAVSQSVNKSLEESFKKSTDETLKVGETEIKKSVVGEDVFVAMQKMQEELAKERHAAEMKQLEVEVEKEYPNLAGSASEKALLLANVKSMPEAVQKMAKEYLAKANEAMGEVVNKETGTGATKDVSTRKEAEDKLVAMAKELSSKEGISYFSAYERVLKSPEGAVLYEQHLSN